MAEHEPDKDKQVKRKVVLLFVAAVAVSGCAGQTRMMDYPAAYVSPAAALRTARYEIQPGPITATAKIEIIDDGQRYPLKAALMIKWPASLRLESIPLLGPPDFFISLDEGEIRIFVASRGSFYAGAATPRNISRFLHIHICATELVSLLLGLSPDIDAGEGNLTGRQEEKLYRVDQEKNDKGKLSIWIDPAINRMVKASFEQDGIKIYEAVFEKHLRTGEYYLPQHIAITGQTNSALKITYTGIERLSNSEASFTLPIPDGITPIPLD